MDRQFLEFWGNYLLMVAKGQRQLEDVAKWMHQGYKGFEDLTSMFANLYGLDQGPSDPPKDAANWNQAMTDFQKSLENWMRPIGWVPAEAHNTLKKKVETLEEKVRAQKETIRQLKNLLNKEGNPHTDVVLGFADLVQKQTREFQDLLKGMEETFDADQTQGHPTTERKKDA